MGLVIRLGLWTGGVIDMFLDVISHDAKGKKHTFNKGDRVFTQSDVVDSLYVVLSGRVKLIRENIEGNSLVIHTAYAGESFAEASLFSSEYHCHCVADSVVELLKFDKSGILELLNQNPESMMMLIKELTGQIRDLRLLGEIKSIYSAKDRIMAFLSYEAQDGVFYYSYSLLDLAQKIGLAHETLYRNLTSLENEGNVSKQEGSITLS